MSVSMEQYNELKAQFAAFQSQVTADVTANAVHISQNKRDMDIAYVVITGASPMARVTLHSMFYRC